MNKFINIFGEECKFDCLGCDIANHKLIPPGGYVYEEDFINISADPEIPIVGFMVLGIKKHIKSINELTRDERIKIMDILNLTIEKMKKVNICEKVLLIQEEKASHFHIWIVPMHSWMNEYKKNVRNINEIINRSKEIFNEETKEELLEAVEVLREEFNNK
ncbi:MAG: HIT family hydrolase [Bacilli bacterium]|nr:HIT family hydrolase [Bacilli bacterium]